MIPKTPCDFAFDALCNVQDLPIPGEMYLTPSGLGVLEHISFSSSSLGVALFSGDDGAEFSHLVTPGWEATIQPVH